MNRIYKVLICAFMIFTSVAYSVSAKPETDLVSKLVSDGWEVNLVTYDEMISQVAEFENKTIEEVMEEIPAPKNKASNQYLSTGRGFKVTSKYYPRVVFYLNIETNSNGVMTDINSVVKTTLDRTNTLSNSSVTSKQFGGEVYVHLQDSKNLYFFVNGDFYDNGTTTHTGSGEADIKDKVTVKYQIQYESNYYAYCFYEETLSIK